MSNKPRDYREAPRPNHPDAMTSEELRKIKFHGLRNNVLSQDLEYWEMGTIVLTASKAEMLVNPNRMEEKLAEHYGFNIPPRFIL